MKRRRLSTVPLVEAPRYDRGISDTLSSLPDSGPSLAWDFNNFGNKMLRKMGWRQGNGIGRELQGVRSLPYDDGMAMMRLT